MKSFRTKDVNGIIIWKTEDEKLHKEDGPAIIYPDGDKWWYINGKIHREDGPAIEGVDGSKEWWVDGKFYGEGKLSLIQMMNYLKVVKEYNKII